MSYKSGMSKIVEELFQAQRRHERGLGVVPPMQGRRQHAEEAIGRSGDVDAPGHDDELTPEGRQQLGELERTAFVVQSAGDLGELTPDAGGDRAQVQAPKLGVEAVEESRGRPRGRPASSRPRAPVAPSTTLCRLPWNGVAEGDDVGERSPLACYRELEAGGARCAC